MKKPVLSLIIVIFVACIILPIIIYFVKDILKSPHFLGNIRLIVYGEEVVLNEKNCNFEVVQGDGVEGKKLSLKNGKITIFEGVYGGPKIKMHIAPEFAKNRISEKFDKGITITFGIFQNTSLKNELNLDVIFSKDGNGNPILKVKQDITGDINRSSEKQYNYEVLVDDSKHSEIDLFTGP